MLCPTGKHPPRIQNFLLGADPINTNIAPGLPKATNDEVVLPDELHLVQQSLAAGLLLVDSQWAEGPPYQLKMTCWCPNMGMICPNLFHSTDFTIPGMPYLHL